MSMPPLLALLACHGSGDDSSAGSVAFTERTDVVVVGSGPAGIAAALSAREAGAEVILLDRSATAADGANYASRLFGAGTALQAEVGVLDSPAQAASEWASLTGVDGQTPSVLAFLDASADILTWLEGFGVEIVGLDDDQDAGEVPRMHQAHGESTQAALVAAFDGTLRTRVNVDALVVEGGRVTGVRWTDLETGETGATGAEAVVVATGGFLRDRARVDALRPELADRRLLYETNPHADGGGLGFLDAVGVTFDSPENIGIYVHAIQDPERGDGEALVLGALDAFLFVDEAGQRFADEGLSRSFDFFEMLPEGEVHVILPDWPGAELRVARPAYNAADPNVTEGYVLSELDTLSEDVFVAATLAELAAAAGIDPSGLEATVEGVNALIEAGGTDELGRSFEGVLPFEDELWWAVRLTPGLAKGFGGVSTDMDARPLDEEGEAIPGLYVAGEAAGMIPGGGAGLGFAGSVTACYYGGRVAGANAADEAL